MPQIEVNSSEEFQELFSSPEPFILHYYTKWCPACRRVKPDFLQAGNAEEYSSLPIYLVDCDREELSADVEDVESIPTTIAYRAGQEFGPYPGYVGYDYLKTWIDSFIEGCRLVDSISNLSDQIDAPVVTLADDEQSSSATTFETEEELCDFIQTHKDAVVLVKDTDTLVSEGISLIIKHLAAFPSFEHLKFGEVDSEEGGMLEKLYLPSHFAPALVYLRNGAVFGLNVDSVKSAADVHASLKDFITASKIADTADKSGALEASLQKVSLKPETKKLEQQETDADSPGTPPSSPDHCVETFHVTNKNPSIVEITSSELFKEITSSHRRVVVHCYSNDVYSSAMSLIHDGASVSPEYDGILFSRVDVDSQQELLEEMDIEVKAQETLILVKGKVVDRKDHVEMNEFKGWLMTHVKGQLLVVPKNSGAHKYNTLRTSPLRGPKGPSVPARNVDLRAEESKDSVTSIASTLSDILVPCTGVGARKIKPGLRDWLLGQRSWKDQEAHCLFTPIPGDDGIEVACAVHNKSRVSITVAHTPSLRKGDQHVVFGIGFSVNVNVRARFTSAIFCVTFERYVDETKRVLLNIHDLSPRDEKGEGTEVTVGEEQAVNAGFQAGAHGGGLQGGLTMQSNKSYTLKTSSRVRGQGLRTPTATWTFEENPGEAGKEGLEPEYPLHVHFSHHSTEAISLKFYAEAVLLEGSRKTVMTIGNEKELFHRELILSV